MTSRGGIQVSVVLSGEDLTMKLSLVIPARDEEGAIETTLSALLWTLREEAIPFEIIVVDDGSADHTPSLVRALAKRHQEIRLVQNTSVHGFGMAVRCGLREMTGDAAAIVMADSSDSPADVVKCYRHLLEGPDCVFGSRFIHGSTVVDYPLHKLVLNRLANWFIKLLFGVPFNDFTNAFKLYRSEVVEGIQ